MEAKGNKMNLEGLPPWEMHDDGLITTSSLANERALLYIFVETAIAHNDNRLRDLLAENTINVEQFPTPDPNPQAAALPTKQEVNLLLSGAYNLVGIKRWWQRPRKSLDRKTPHEVWETDPQRVWNVAREIVTGVFQERKD